MRQTINRVLLIARLVAVITPSALPLVPYRKPNKSEQLMTMEQLSLITRRKHGRAKGDANKSVY